MLEENFNHSVVTHMTTIALKTKFAAAKKLLLALPFLAILAVAIPSAHADDDHGFYRRHGYYRHHYYHHGYYGHRHYRYEHGRRYYYYGNYYPGINLHIAL